MTLFLFTTLSSALCGFAQEDCLKSSEKFLDEFDAVLVLKEPYCKACLYDVSHFLDSVGVRKRKIVVLIEHGNGGAYRLRIENSVMEKMGIKRKRVIGVEKFDCDLLNGLYYVYKDGDVVIWHSNP